MVGRDEIVSVIVPVDKLGAQVLFISDEEARTKDPGTKRNLGAMKAGGSIYAFIDDDAYPSLQWLGAAKEVFKEDPTIGVVCGPAVTAPSDGGWHKVSGETYKAMAQKHKGRYTPVERCEVDEAPSCNMLVRRDVYWKVGGFDEGVWPGEDTVFCGKVKRLGYKIVYDPRVLVYHHRRGFWGHLRQVGRYGRMRGKFVKLYPETSRKWEYFMPALVVLLLSLTVIVYGINFIRGLLE